METRTRHTLIPPGTYTVQVDDVEETESQTTGRPLLRLHLRLLVDGKPTDRLLHDLLAPTTEAALWKVATWTGNASGLADLSQLEGRKFFVAVSHDEFNDTKVERLSVLAEVL